MAQGDLPLLDGPMDGSLPEAEARLLAELREGHSEAGHRFVREYYPWIYRYLLSLTGHRETAEDLTQETFLQAWRHLDQFQGRASLRLWLHAIARREFLQAKRRQRAVISLEEAAELSEPHSGAWTDAAELRVLLSSLPEEQQEVMLLYSLTGLSSTEIAQLLRTPARTVRRWIGAARSHLAQALGEGDLAYLNEPSMPMRQWAWLPLDQMYALEQRLARGSSGDWEARGPGTETEDNMERREFLRHAAAGAAGLMLPESEKAVVDSRLTRKATLTFKGTALADVCEHLRGETGVHLGAGPSVADEKVTLFCKQMPLRDIMRQLSRPFGYTWLRSSRASEYRYELVQDLRSQLLEEELRNRDRNAALLSLEREIQRFYPFLDLSPDEAQARAKTAPPAEKQLLEQLASYGWGVIQTYAGLSPKELAALRAGRELVFEDVRPGEKPFWSDHQVSSLPPDVARGVLQSWRDFRLPPREDGFDVERALQSNNTEGLLLTAIPEARAIIFLRLTQSELGQFTLDGSAGFHTIGRQGKRPRDTDMLASSGPCAVGQSPSLLKPDNAAANASLSRDPTLRSPVTVRPEPSCPAGRTGRQGEGSTRPGIDVGESEPKVTTADVLEALHRATGLSIVADFYTRLYEPGAVSCTDRTLFEALNQFADTMRLRWHNEGSWLQFRSASFYDDRLKAVPNHLLARWAASRREHGMLTLDDLVEIAQLPDAQLDASDMAVGAWECYGLAEWNLGCDSRLRKQLRYLAGFTSAQRQEAMSPTGLAFTRMSLAQQQGFLTYGLRPLMPPLQSLEDLAGAVLRVDYTQPGWFEWRVAGPYWLPWIVPLEPGERGRRALRPPVRERTREAALQALHRLDPQIREAVLQVARRFAPSGQDVQIASQEAEVVPTDLDLVFIYLPGASNRIVASLVGRRIDTGAMTW
jgi:RNA polymerase sigma-70 factor (ECF subfamily)